MPINCLCSLVIIPLEENYLLSFHLWACIKVTRLLGFYLLLFIFVFRDCYFSFVYFLLLADDTHILGLTSFVPFSFDHFAFELTLMGLVVQPYKCIAWSPSNLPLGFSPH
jgi:hypothetical protein